MFLQISRWTERGLCSSTWMGCKEAFIVSRDKSFKRIRSYHDPFWLSHQSPDRPGSAASGPSDEEQEVVGQTQRRPNTDRSCVVPSSWTIKTKTWGLRLLIEACLAEHEHETYNQE